MLNFSEKFLDVPVEDGKLKILEESTLYAPHAYNPPQPWRVVVVKSPERVRELVKFHRIKSPVIFLFFVNRGVATVNSMVNLASGCAQAVNLAVQASALNLACFIDIDPPKDFVDKAFEMAKISKTEYDLSAVGFVGYPAKEEKKVFFEVERRG
jgi:nitroreductase